LPPPKAGFVQPDLHQMQGWSTWRALDALTRWAVAVFSTVAGTLTCHRRFYTPELRTPRNFGHPGTSGTPRHFWCGRCCRWVAAGAGVGAARAGVGAAGAEVGAAGAGVAAGAVDGCCRRLGCCGRGQRDAQAACGCSMSARGRILFSPRLGTGKFSNTFL